MSVSVDSKFARFGSKSFAINKITSVDVRTVTTPPGKGWIAAVAVSVLCFLGSQTSSGMLGGGVLFAAVAWYLYTHKGNETVHQLFLVTSGSETQAYQSSDQDEVFMLRDSIEEAMAAS